MGHFSNRERKQWSGLRGPPRAGGEALQRVPCRRAGAWPPENSPRPTPAVAEGPASGAASCGTSKAAVGFGGWLGEEGARGAVPARPGAALEDLEPGQAGPRSQAEKSQLGSGWVRRSARPPGPCSQAQARKLIRGWNFLFSKIIADFF